MLRYLSFFQTSVTVASCLRLPRNLATDFARKEVFLETLGRELGKAAARVTQFALGRVLFSMSFCSALKIGPVWVVLGGATD